MRLPPAAGLSLLWLCALAALAAPDADQPVVAVTGGLIRGRRLAEGGAAFRGVPFAAPPVGSLRWQAPHPVEPWTGIRDAAVPGAPAYQPALGWNNAFAAQSSEDCLYLDVWTPAVTPAAPVPVMVWIHGGGNVAGAGGADPLYDGRALLRRGVVLVVIEYRMGIFGFFAHPELSQESPHHASGNYGILDQLAALHWVHDNIARLGGDPGNVTLFGQSAGGSDVFALLASPLARGLAHRAIAESGPLAPDMIQPLDAAETAGRDRFRDRGGRVLPLAALRGLSAADLQKHAGPLKPLTVDGWVFPESPLAAWRRHHELPVPLLEGSNAIEFTYAGSPESLAAALRAAFGPDAGPALALYGVSGTAPASDPKYGTAADQWGTDLFRCPPMVLAGWHAAAGRAAWQYEFDRAIPPKPQTAHSAELPYVFGNLGKDGSMPGDYTAADRHLSDLIQDYWTTFAKTGNPNGAGRPAWPPYGLPAASSLDFTAAGEAVAAPAGRAPFRDLFRAQLERLTERD